MSRRWQYQQRAVPVLNLTGNATVVVQTYTAVPAFNKTLSFQTLAFVPPSESVTVDKWFASLASPIRLKLKATESPSFAYGATPIVNTADQWWTNFATPTKAAARIVEYPAFAYGAVPIVSTPDRWWNNLEVPPKARARTVDYNASAFVPTASETVTVDKWFASFADLLRPAKRAAEYPAFTYGALPIVNTTDQWWTNWAIPTKAAPRTIEYPSFAYGPTPIVSTPDRWWIPFTDPPKAKPRAVEYLAYAAGFPSFENVTIDKWLEQWSEPSVKFKRRTTDFPAFTYGAAPIVNNVDQWWQNLATPPKVKPRTVEYPTFTYGPTPIVSTPDRWWQPLAEPPRAKARAAEYQAFTYPYVFALAETITVDKWYQALSERIVKSAPRATEYPAFTFGSTPIVNTTDQWWQNFSIPPKAKPRTVEFLAFTDGRPTIVPESITLDKWYRPLVDPKTLKQARATDFPAFAYGPTPIVSTPDRWWRNLETPPKAKPRAAEYPFTAYAPYRPLIGKDITWHRALNEPVRFRRFNAALQQGYFFIPFTGHEVVFTDRWFVPFTQPKRNRFGQVYWEQRDFFYSYFPTPVVRVVARAYIIC